MNERERQLIEGIINIGNRRIHNRCIQLLFHGQDIAGRDERTRYKKNDYVVALEGAVMTCFSGKRYQGKFADTYMVFESLFVTYLEHIKPEKLREIDDLKNWLFVAASRFCNSNRNKINELLSIDKEYDTEKYDDGLKTQGHENETSEEQEYMPKGESEFHQKTLEDCDDTNVSDDLTEQSDTSDWASSLLDLYIGKISNAYYRDLIRAIKLENVPVETMSEDYGKSIDNIYRDYNRAWDKLLQVSLPDIRIRSKRLFKKYESEFDDNQASLLNKFFFGGHNLKTIANSEGMKQDDLEKAIVKIYKVLLKTAKRETELDEKEQRKEAREQRHAEKETETRKKEQRRIAKERKKCKSSTTEVIENTESGCL